MMTDTNDRIVTARVRAFTGRGLETLRCRVEADGTVRVWDDIAGHYTICHILTPSAQRRVRRLASRA